MKYLIVSDIHGSLPALERVLDFFHEKKCDMMILLGDILNYGPRNGLPDGLNPMEIANKLNSMSEKIMAIRGNCDSEVDQMLLDFPILSDYLLLCDEGKKIFLTHGHIYNENNLPKGKFDLIVYGHTHLWKAEKINDTLICNTGSPTFPKGGNPKTFCIYEKNTISHFDLTGNLLKETLVE